MIYTIIDDKGRKQTFEGIRRVHNLTKGYIFLALVEIEGEIDLWWLENEKLALEELERYYRMDGFNCKIKIFREIGLSCLF